ncbi:MAG: hypothetical protein H0W30_19905 [Gemmatimonadaceae bacterium]|nr:hypothetical protein [Gemmatimonadaceae bacterium]
MKMILGALADYASDAGRGKLTLVGVFDTIFAMTDARPIPFPQATAVVVVSASIVEGSDHRVTLSFEDADGQNLGQLDLPLLFTTRGPGYPQRAQLLINLGQFAVPDLGDYLIRVRVEGHIIGEIPFYIVDAPPHLKQQAQSLQPPKS